MKILLTVLVARCVLSQSTIDDNESSLEQLQLKIDKLEQEQQQMSQTLYRYQQQFSELDELRTILADHLGKLGIAGDACGQYNLSYADRGHSPMAAADGCGERKSGEFSLFC